MDATGYDHFRERRDATIWQQMNAILRILLLIAVWLLMVSFFLPPYRQLQRDRATYDKLNTQLADNKAVLTRLTKKIALLKTDPTYLETLARDSLDVMKDGETIFRLEAPGKGR